MDFEWVVAAALAEDIGAGDVTSQATVPEDARGVATITQKAPGVIAGLDAAHACFVARDPDIAVERLAQDGEFSDERRPVLQATGPTRALLEAERTALNF